MSAASSRRNLRRANVRQLSQREPDLSHRQIAERLGISKDTVRRDLSTAAGEADADGANPDAPNAPDEPQVSAGGADGANPDAPDEPRRALAWQVAPLAGAPDLSQWPALRQDLAQLAQSGISAEALVHQAIASVAHAYRGALARGELRPGDRFVVGAVDLLPAALVDDRPVPDSVLRP